MGQGGSPKYGRFRQVRRLDAGAYGTVHVAVDDATGARAAVKVLDRQGSDGEVLARFRREVGLLERFEHPGIPTLLASGLSEEPPWFATTYVGGLSLRQLVDRCSRPFPSQAVLHLAVALGETLEYLHRTTAHRDLKPENVLVTRERPLMIDFGLSRSDGQPGLTRSGYLVGTPTYLAPERAGNGYTVDDRKADVFELAAALIYPLRKDFPRKVAVQGEQIVGIGPIEFDGVPDVLRPLLRTATDADPDRRPTAGEFAELARALLTTRSLTEALPAEATTQLDQQDRDDIALRGAVGAPEPEPTRPTTPPGTAGGPGGTRALPSEVLAPPLSATRRPRGPACRFGDGPAAVAVADDHRLVVLTRGGEVCVDAGDGRDPRRWRRHLDGRALGVMASSVFVGAEDGFVHVLDLVSGATVDRLWVGGPVTQLRTVGGWVVAGGAGGVLCAFSGKGRGLLAEWALGAPVDAIADAGRSRVVVATADGVVHAVDLRARDRSWTVPAGDRVLALAASADVVAVATADGSLRLLRADGTALTTVSTATPAAAVVARGAVAMVVALDGTTVVAGAGGERSRRELGVAVRRSVALGHGRLFVGTLEGEVLALDLDDAEPTVVARVGAPVEVPVAVDGDVLLVGRSDGAVAVVDLPAGRPGGTVEYTAPRTTPAESGRTVRLHRMPPADRHVAARCPICRWSVSGGWCPECRHSTADPATPARQRDHDLAAAVRASSGAVLIHCRPSGSSEPDVELARARDHVRRADEDRAAQGHLAGAVEDTVARLVYGEVDRVVLVEIDEESVRARVLRRDTNGVPLVGSNAGPWPLRDLVEAGGDATLRRYLLAGGIVDGGSDPSASTVRVLAGSIRDELALDDPRTDLAVIRRAAGWAFPDRVVEALRVGRPPRADVVRPPRHLDLDAYAGQLCANAPLRWAHHLVVAQVGSDGGVRASSVPLFPAGATPWSGFASTSVWIRRAAGSEGAIYLPVARAGREAPVSWPLVGIGRIDDLPAGEGEVQVRLVAGTDVHLDLVVGSGESRRLPSAPFAEDPRPSLPAVHRSVSPVDVLVAVELGGPPDVVARRLSLVGAVAGALEKRAAYLPGRVRLGVVGYDDHVAERGAWRDELQIVAFGPPGRAGATAMGWTSRPGLDTHGSALDDALREAAGAAWAGGSERALLVLGSRPPAVFPQLEERARVCPHKTRWEDHLEHLGAAVRHVAVVDEPRFVTAEDDPTAPRDLTRRVWNRLGSTARWSLDDCPVADLVAAVAPGPTAPSGRLELALAGPPHAGTGGRT
ncbi:protein kinase domain-containing protein [Actinomycetospora termitidis]|uniref:non-specific serine/threonine protein kinase n=1 Tax=Actinomycetospora termitidis TaxID=3053470 RepID=A0ABT7MEA4_9PSEU|nr:serine/threonine-protein kinase [Actinomycetospora sp. Odt1-22]MDL5158992.1 serine/threonine-protein kinase [Actinomycetospora sp. Odt1-22]